MSIKIAICLSGEPRYRERAANSIHNFIKNDINNECNVDIFYHFWDNITKRQSDIIDQPVLEKINKHDLELEFKPTIGVCENKDCLDEYIDYAWNHISKLKIEQNAEFKDTKINNKDIFSRLVKTTNYPPYSQLISMYKSLKLMTDYSDKNDKHYDIIIRSRSDVEFYNINYKSIETIINKNKLSRYVQFPSISVRNVLGEKSPFTEYCFFVSSSAIINTDLLEDFVTRLCNILIYVKEKPSPNKNIIVFRSSHNTVPLILSKNKKTELGAPIGGFGYKLKQMKSNRTNYQ